MIELYSKIGDRALRVPDPFFQFPGGEWHMKVESNHWTGNEIAWISGSDVNDYVKMALWSQAVKAQGGTATAVIPYLPAARSDRGMPTGSIVYADLIRNSGVERVITFDPHSAFMPWYLEKNGVNVEAYLLSDFPKLTRKLPGYDGIISPDAGAHGRARAMQEALDCTTMVVGEKLRNFETGELSGFRCEKLPNYGGHYLIVDDICDGGGTFLGLLGAIRSNAIEQLRSESIDQVVSRYIGPTFDLFVSHGIFSRGFETLEQGFTNIFSTNSLPQDETHVTVFDIKSELIGKV